MSGLRVIEGEKGRYSFKWLERALLGVEHRYDYLKTERKAIFMNKLYRCPDLMYL